MVDKNSDHNKIISDVAKEMLKPIGLKQKGKSRIWLDDNGWFTTIVEYQPSSYDKGTFLNVGINFNWYLKEHYSFDYGSRECSFNEFQEMDSFRSQVIDISNIAISKVIEYRKFADLEHAKNRLLKSCSIGNNIWKDYHCGMICVLNKDFAIAEKYFKSVLKSDNEVKWAIELKHNVQTLVDILSDEAALEVYIDSLICDSRKLLKLPENKHVG